MKFKIIWPGKTKDKEIKAIQEKYLKKINRLVPCTLIECKEAKGIKDRFAKRIKKIEKNHIEKHIEDDYIICLFDKGKQMNSKEFAEFLERIVKSPTPNLTFIIGGSEGLEEGFIEKADFILSLSPMTFSHELARIMLLEQVYRALTIMKGMKYAK